MMAKSALPHTGVVTRLKPSKLHGVGVFAIQRIRRGTLLFDSSEEMIWINEAELNDLPNEVRKLYDDFAIIKDGQYGCPVNFNKLTMAWYLNDSDNPNILVDGDYNMWAARDIAEGEELTIDSSKFSAQPYKYLASATGE
jgi:SET domain-containing protein